MQDLIERIVTATGLDRARAEKALGITLSLLKSQGNADKVAELFAKLPGADDMADAQGGSASGSGFLAKLGGGMMGGPLAAITKLSAAGLSMEQIKQLGTVTLDYAKEKAGAQLVKEAAGAIPGLGGYV